MALIVPVGTGEVKVEKAMAAHGWSKERRTVPDYRDHNHPLYRRCLEALHPFFMVGGVYVPQQNHL
jgi:hypothetical protein